MKTMILQTPHRAKSARWGPRRVLFTLAILAGLSAAPDAQSFRWEANSRSYDVGDRIERAFEQAERNIERQWRNIERLWDQRLRNAERISEQAQRNAERRADAIQREVRARVQRQIVNETRSYRYYSAPFAAPRAERYADMQVGTDADPCRNYNDRDDDYYQHCEVRDSTLPPGPLNVDAGQNGGVSVEAWDRNEIRVRAIVRGSARDEARAKGIAGQVQVQSGGGRVYATGPDLDRREWWSVSYRINVPRQNDLDLSATNGGITILGVSGNLRFDTTNGGVKLQDVGGRVNGATRNGGLDVRLNGTRWEGEGLDVETSNGGVTLSIPDGYNAELETRTVNGGLSIDFPITVQGELTSRRGITTTLGSGGPPVRARTTNGGVRIRRN
jgi:Putative adhesin